MLALINETIIKTSDNTVKAVLLEILNSEDDNLSIVPAVQRMRGNLKALGIYKEYPEYKDGRNAS